MVKKAMQAAPAVKEKKRGFLYNMRKYKYLYIMLIPTVVCLAIFNYYPLWGLRMAFYNYKPWLGFDGSTYVGWQNFTTLFRLPEFGRLIRNTLILNVYKIIFGFPAPIIFALLLNEVRSRAYKRTLQTISYLPHFVSWVIVQGIMYALINSQYGLINNMIKALGATPPKWYAAPEMWRAILVITDIWKSVGFSSILYLAAIANVNEEWYEAAVIDGASRFRQVWSITIPCIMPTVIVMFIMQMGQLMNGSFQQVMTLVGSNTPLYKTVETLDYYIYRVGLGKQKYSLGTAAGIFQSLIGLILVVVTNKIANKVGDMGIW